MLEDVRPGFAPSAVTSEGSGASPSASIALVHDPLDARVFQSSVASGLTPPWLLLALVLHIGIGTAIAAGWIEWTDPRALAGAGGANLDAISVEVEILPSIAVARAQPGPTAEEAVAASADQADGTKPVQPAKTTPVAGEMTKSEDTTNLERAIEFHPEREPEWRQESARIATRDDPRPAEVEATVLPPSNLELPKPTAPGPKTEGVKSSPPSTPPGGVASSGADQANRPASVRAAAASPGEMRAFARSLAEALARTRPPNGSARAKGTVNVEFIVGEEGRAETARVARSSGSRALDEMAIDAVRKARLPRPPAGVTLAERTFVVPYHFR